MGEKIKIINFDFNREIHYKVVSESTDRNSDLMNFGDKSERESSLLESFVRSQILDKAY